MDKPSATNSGLDTVREEIDAIDDGLVELLGARFAVVEKIHAVKTASGEDGALPLRPAREAEIMRRLLDAAGNAVPPAAIWRIWRTIICQSSLAQGDIVIETTRPVIANETTRKALEDFFPAIPVNPNTSLESAIEQTAASPMHICACPANSAFVGALAGLGQHSLGVIALVNVPGAGAGGNLLILGDAPAAPTGADETLVKSKGRLPREFGPAPLWETETADGFHLTSLPGFLSPSEGPLIGLERSNTRLDLKVMGRYPSPLEI